MSTATHIDKKKILVPELRFKEYNLEWERLKLSAKMEIFRGASPRPKGDPRYYGGRIPRLMIQDATRDGKYAFPKIDFLTEEGAKKSRLLKKGSVVLSCSGTRVAIPTILGIDACIHDGWLAFRNFKDIDEEFLYNLFVKLHERMQGEATTGGVFNNLTTSIVKDLKLGFPSLPEQQKIASFLSAVDEKIQQLSRKKALLEQYKKSIMQQLFSGKLRFKDENGEDYPEWEEKKLGDIGKIRMCKRVFSHETSESGEIPFYKIGTFGKEADAFITKELYDYYKEKFSFPKTGEILLSASGTLGRTVIYDGSPSYFQDSNIVWIENNEENTTNSFLYFIYQIVRYDSEGGTIQRLYNSIISNTKFKNPSLPEQQKIATFLSSIDTKIESVNQQITQTQSFKKGLLQQLFV